MSDLKATLKAMKAHMDAAQFQQALDVSTPLLSDRSTLESLVKESKARPLLYTLFAFAGLAHFNLANLDQAEACYLKAVKIAEEQFPAWKGLYDLYSQKGSKEQVRTALEKLVKVAPSGLRKLSYSSQLIRLQLEQPASASTPSPSDLSSSIHSLLSDPALSVPADSKDPAKDAVEVSRLKLELHTSALLAHEAQEQVEKSTELRVRLERQLKKFRDEKDKAAKLKAQQAASKSGAIAAAVQAAKGGAGSSLTPEEEEADIVRRVLLKLERDYLEKKEVEEMQQQVLSLPAPSPDTLDPNHLLVHEKCLERLVLNAYAHSVWTATSSLDQFDQAIKAIEHKAREIISLSPSSPSPYACRILIGLTWSIGGGGGGDANRRDSLMSHQELVLQSIRAMGAEGGSNEESEGWRWMGWHALATSMVATESLPDLTTLPMPNSLKAALDDLKDPPPSTVYEWAEIILKNVAEPAAPALITTVDAALSSVSTSRSPIFHTPSPFKPSFMSLVTLSYALQQQGEAKHKECMATLQQAFAAIKAYRTAVPFDILRAARASTHAELTLASAYSTRVLDERILDTATKLFLRIWKLSQAGSEAEKQSIDRSAQIRALQGLVHCALLKKPRPDYATADVYVSELIKLASGDAWVWGMRGLMKLQQAKAIKDTKGASTEYMPLLKEAATVLEQATKLNPDSPNHHFRLGQAYFEQDEEGQDQTRREEQYAKKSFEKAAELAGAAVAAAMPGSAAAASAKTLQADALSHLGLFHSTVSHDASAAKQAYVSSLKVDPSNEMAGPALCHHILTAGGTLDRTTAPPTTASTKEKQAFVQRVNAVRALAQAAVQHSPRCVWGWVHLARCQMTLRDVSSAVSSYQTAVRLSDGTSLHSARCWQELSECYNSEGQFISAFKAIRRCVEIMDLLNPPDGDLDEVALQARELNYYLLAKCQLNLGEMEECIRTLHTVLSGPHADHGRTPFIPAVQLLAEALYVHANVQAQAGAYGAAMRGMERAIQVAKQCVEAINNYASASSSDHTTPSQLVSVWKLLGDCYALYHTLPVDDSSSPPDLTADSEDSLPPPSSDLPLLEARKVQLLTLATRAYTKAAHLDPTVSEHWYDAALAQLRAGLALHAPAPAPNSTTEEGKNEDMVERPLHPLESSYRLRARSLLESALLLSPSNSVYWNLLAVLDGRPAIRQHALVQAVTVEPKDAIGWTSLGCFYLQQSAQQRSAEERQILMGVSRHALEVSQTLDPANPTLWMAQGLFNHSVGTLEAYVQAKACFQRSLELYATPLARFGLAYTAYCTGDIPLARLSILKFTEQCPRHATALNLRGLIAEHVVQGCGSQSKDGVVDSNNGAAAQVAQEAVDAFQRSEQLLLVDPNFSTDEGRRTELVRMVRSNRARALCTAGRYVESIELYQSLIQAAAEMASSGAVSPEGVLATAVTLHVELAMVYARAGSIDQALSVQGTAAAISAQQVETAAPEQKDELVLKRRTLLVQQAQLHALIKQYDQAKQLLQQSVSEHPDHPHPHHYFHVMCVLYALSLHQSDLSTATYATDMMAQCLSGLMAGQSASGGGEDVMHTLMPTFLRIQAHVSILQGDHDKARRCHAKIIHLDPTNMTSWNEFYAFILEQQRQAFTMATGSTPVAFTPVSTILATATLPPLDSIPLTNRTAESAFFQRMELLALSFLAVGRVGEVAHSASASPPDLSDEKDSSEADQLAAAAETDDDTESVAAETDDTVDADVRDKSVPYGQVGPQPTAEADAWPRVKNLNAQRVSAHLLHMNPTQTSYWGIQASSLYAQAVQAAATRSTASAASTLFSKAIKLLQVYTQLLTTDLTSQSGVDAASASATHTALMTDLCNAQVMLVDSMLRRASMATAGEEAAADVQQAAMLLQAILEQQQQAGASFPLHASLLWVLRARLALRQEDQATALSAYRSALEAAPLAVEIWEEMSEVYRSQQALPAAEACLQAALTLLKQAEAEGKVPSESIQPLLLRVYLRLAHHCYSARRFAAGLEFAQAAAKSTGSAGDSSPAAWHLLGLFHSALHHPDQAMRAFQTALNLVRGVKDCAPTSPLLAAHLDVPVSSLRFNVALLFMRSAQAAANESTAAAASQEAEELLQEEVHLEGGSSQCAPLYFQLAKLSVQQRDWSAASTYLRTALELRPHSPFYQQLQKEIEHSSASGSSAAEKGAEQWDD